MAKHSFNRQMFAGCKSEEDFEKVIIDELSLDTDIYIASDKDDALEWLKNVYEDADDYTDEDLNSLCIFSEKFSLLDEDDVNYIISVRIEEHAIDTGSVFYAYTYYVSML